MSKQSEQEVQPGWKNNLKKRSEIHCKFADKIRISVSCIKQTFIFDVWLEREREGTKKWNETHDVQRTKL